MSLSEPVETAEEASSAQLAKVLRLTATLCDRVLDAQIMKQPVPDDQVRALAGAARLLRDVGVEWPPLLSQVLHELALKIEDGEPSGDAAEGDAKVTRLNRFLNAFRKDRARP